MLDNQLLIELKAFIETNFNPKYHLLLESVSKNATHKAVEEIEVFISNRSHPCLKEELTRLMILKGKSESEIYKRAGIDRRFFSKIFCIPDYHPKKGKIIAIAIALELDILETEELLNSAGYSLSNSSKGDLVIKFFIEKKIFDIDYVNEALFHYTQKLLDQYIF